MKFRELLAVRRSLRERRKHSWDEFAALAGNVASLEDIDILRSHLRRDYAPPRDAARRNWEADNAGHVALALVTRAAFVDLSADIRPWLIGAQDGADQIFTTGPHVLEICASDYHDVTALRVLFEMADGANPWVRIHLDRALSNYADTSLLALMRQTQSQQVARLLAGNSGDADDWQLRSLKAFLSHERALTFLQEAAAKGRIWAVESLVFGPRAVEWKYFDTLRVHGVEEGDALVNAMITNVSLGAEPSYCFGLRALQERPDLGEDLREGLALLQLQGRTTEANG